MTEIAVSACIDRNPYWDWHSLLIAAAFHRRVWRNHLDRSNEVNGYGWNEEQLRTIQGLISYEAKHGQDDAMMRWALEEGDKVLATWFQGRAIVNWLESQHEETPEELAERYLTLGELIR